MNPIVRTGRWTVLLLTTVHLACGPNTMAGLGPVDCSPLDSSPITGSVLSGPTNQVVDQDLSISGVLYNPTGLAVRQVLVANLPATNQTLNFSTWTAKIPVNTLASMITDPNAQQVTISVQAVDTCNRAHAIDSFSVKVDRNPEAVVSQLKAVATIAGGQSYLPANGSAVALITFTANPEANRAPLQLSTTLGSFVGPSDLALTLTSQNGEPATALAYFGANNPGTAFITGTSKGVVASVPVKVAGPPRLLPVKTTLAPDSSYRISALSDGSISACQATPAPGVTVKSGTQDLTAAPGGQDVDGDGAIDIDVVTSTSFTPGPTVTITCYDPYNQVGSATLQ